MNSLISKALVVLALTCSTSANQDSNDFFSHVLNEAKELVLQEAKELVIKNKDDINEYVDKIAHGIEDIADINIDQDKIKEAAEVFAHDLEQAV
jgi:hypothetical protein